MNLVVIFRSTNGDWCPVRLMWQVPAPAVCSHHESGLPYSDVKFVSADSVQAQMPTHTVSFQGARLSPRQRLLMEQRQKVRSGFLNNHLAQQVEDTLKSVEARHTFSSEPLIHLDRDKMFGKEGKGTPSFVDWINQ